MQLVLVCVLVLSLLQPGLLQDGETEATPTNGGEELSQSITELKSIVLALSKQMVDFSHEVRGQLAAMNATVNTLRESLTREVVRNRQWIKAVNRRVETAEAKQFQIVYTSNNISTGVDLLKGEVIAIRQSLNEANLREQASISSQLATTTDQLSTGLDQLRRDFTANQQSSGLAHNRTQVQLEELGISFQQQCQQPSQLANITDQLSTELKQLRQELTTSQHNIVLASYNMEVQLEALNTSLQGQCQQTSLEALQDSLAAHTRQLATATDQLSTGHQALQDGLTEQLQTVSSDCDNQTAELLQGQKTVLETLYGIEEKLGYRYTCGGTPGWRRVAFLNMTDPSQDCPSGWNLTTHSVRTCGRASSEQLTCDPVTFPVIGGEYYRVCGRIRAYQYGGALAFTGSTLLGRPLDSSYVDGISITHGRHQRQHIWTFAVGLAQEYNGYSLLQLYCYCDVQTHPNSDQTIPPSFVGNDYFCESGESGQRYTFRLYSENPLWDGQNCGQNSTCCSMNNPPYFMKDLPAPTTDDIEVRICFNSISSSSDVPIELLEIYVQ